MSRRYHSISSDDEEDILEYENRGKYLQCYGEQAAWKLEEADTIESLRAAGFDTHKRRFRSWRDCRRVCSFRCCFSTLFLLSFVVLTFLAAYLFIYDPIATPLKLYDYVVVGSGPGGSIVSRRLADQGHQVLLLEAGGPSQYSLGGRDIFEGPLTRFDIPAFWSSLYAFPEYHWNGFGLPGVIAGKALGGSGVENAMLYVRSTPLDMERWNMSAAWTWDQMLDAYLAMEEYCPPNEDDHITTQPYHTIIPLKTPGFASMERIMVARPNSIDPVALPFVQAAQHVGIKVTSDFNAPGGREGVGWYDFNIRAGVRDSVASRFLAPMLEGRFPLSKTGVTSSAHGTYQYSTDPALSGFANFDIAIGATVERVLLNGGGDTGLAKCREDENRRKLENENVHLDKEKKAQLPNIEGNIFSWFKNLFGSAARADRRKLPRAYGVAFRQAGVEKIVYLKTPKVEVGSNGQTNSLMGPSVILSAGALGTPKILLNSGIGPIDTMLAAGMCPRVNSPQVGRNLVDHPTVGMIFATNPTLSSQYPSAYDLLSTWESYTSSVKEDTEMLNMCPLKENTGVNDTNNIQSGIGLLGSPGISCGAFLTSPFAKARSRKIGLKGRTQPDIQLTVFPTVSEPHMRMLSKVMNTTRLGSGSKDMLITVSLLDPIANYALSLNASHPIEGAPVFSIPDGMDSYLQELDLKRLSWGVEQVRKIMSALPISSLVGQELSPGASVADQTLEAWIRLHAFPNSHWVGSCRMGPSGDASSPHSWKNDVLSSAVDERLRLRGVTGIYVADASVIPSIPNGNVHSTVAAFAYRAADFIIQDAGTVSNSAQ